MSKPRKKYKPKPCGSTRNIRPFAMKEDFEEIESVFRQLKTGEITEAKDPRNGQWVLVYKKADGTICYLLKVATEWVNFFAELATHYIPDYNDQPMRKLLTKLRIGQSLDMQTVLDAEKVLDIQRKLYLMADAKVYNAIGSKVVADFYEYNTRGTEVAA
jgi:hypothetical protein